MCCRIFLTAEFNSLYSEQSRWSSGLVLSDLVPRMVTDQASELIFYILKLLLSLWSKCNHKYNPSKSIIYLKWRCWRQLVSVVTVISMNHNLLKHFFCAVLIDVPSGPCLMGFWMLACRAGAGRCASLWLISDFSNLFSNLVNKQTSPLFYCTVQDMQLIDYCVIFPVSIHNAIMQLHVVCSGAESSQHRISWI